MSKQDWIAQLFEEHRTRLRAVAYRILGSLSDADDAVQEAWIRLSRSDDGDIDNVSGWLTTVVARICLNVLRARRSRREEPIGLQMPDPIVSRADTADPEHAVVLADSIGLALLVVLQTLAPEERLAFVLHDMFSVPFDEIGPIVGRSPTAARQLASRARRRVRGAAPRPDGDFTRRRHVVDAFLAAARDGDFDALLAVLDPAVVIRADRGTLQVIRGARAVAERALTFSRLAESVQTALVNGSPGIVSRLPGGRPLAVMGFTVVHGKIIEIDILADSARLAKIDLD